ncbi:type II toxin-antitoxin system Phd/YefM family antitoxin [[Collinsella] massiliensis]|uniref:Antitoxin n=1 Tax=[Collinsella] massiliensis TaxID=1232426 RepID=A0A1Y3XSJ8_9ACTN|nr:type II toxin-antitoxin system Phd/YefM family antitoxin [[Collinsella] massiliensis]OUN86237.1 prevent-host-death protein [[Collinsella] massiliensis]
MTTMTATALRKDLYNTIERVNEDCAPVHITSSRGKGAVLIGEDDWASIEETLYLQSIPGMTESILAAREEPREEALHLEDVEW